MLVEHLIDKHLTRRWRLREQARSAVVDPSIASLDIRADATRFGRDFRASNLYPGSVQSWVEAVDSFGRFLVEQGMPTLHEAMCDQSHGMWASLLIVADAAGGDWPPHARQVAVVLSAEEEQRPTLGVQQLMDVRDPRDHRYCFASDLEDAWSRDVVGPDPSAGTVASVAGLAKACLTPPAQPEL